MSEPINFKGSKEGIVVLLDLNVEFETLCQLMVQKLLESKSFFGEHAGLVINTGDQLLDAGQQLALRVLMQSIGHEVKGFLPQETKQPPKVETPKEEMIPQKQEITTPIPASEPEQITEPQGENEISKKSLTRSKVGRVAAQSNIINTDLSGFESYIADGGVLIRKNIRSGQNISYDGTLIVMGDVNAGAELVATGHIFVLGTLRGLAHAGCNNNPDAVVYATHLAPVQLRIADYIADMKEEAGTKKSPELARVVDQKIVIETI